MVEGVNEGVIEGVNLLLKAIQKNTGKRVPQLAKIVHIPPKTIERWVKQLKEEGKIEFRGSPKKGGYWVRWSEKVVGKGLDRTAD